MRPRGGIIGASVTPTQSAASGVWTVREAEAYARGGAWPALPGAPTSVSGTAGSGQVSLTWTAPTSTGGSSITDYTVQYSSNSGSTWTTFSRSASTATSATVTGLSNGSYVFRVAAVNATGAGPYSTTSSSVTLSSTKLTIARANGTSTFTGSGTSSDPYVRAARVLCTQSDALVTGGSLSNGSGANYSFTATASGTATVSLKFWDDFDNSDQAGIYKNGTVQGGVFGDTGGASITRTFSVVSGDVITFRIEQTQTSFGNVSVYVT